MRKLFVVTDEDHAEIMRILEKEDDLTRPDSLLSTQKMINNHWKDIAKRYGFELDTLVRISRRRFTAIAVKKKE